MIRDLTRGERDENCTWCLLEQIPTGIRSYRRLPKTATWAFMTQHGGTGKVEIRLVMTTRMAAIGRQ